MNSRNHVPGIHVMSSILKVAPQSGLGFERWLDKLTELSVLVMLISAFPQYSTLTMPSICKTHALCTVVTSQTQNSCWCL